jgi:hypothetical protein
LIAIWVQVPGEREREGEASEPALLTVLGPLRRWILAQLSSVFGERITRYAVEREEGAT